MEYFVRQITNKIYEIAKFDFSSKPVEVYVLTKNLSTGFVHCSCPGFRRNQDKNHKHIVMLNNFEDNGTNLFDGEFNGDKFLDD